MSSKKRHITRSWQEIAQEAQDYRDASLSQVEVSNAFKDKPFPKNLPKNSTIIPKDLLCDIDIKITETLLEELVEALATGILTATQVTTAFLRRAVLAQKLVCSLLPPSKGYNKNVHLILTCKTNCITELLSQQALARAKFIDDYYAKYKKPLGPLHGLPISVKEMIGMKDLGLNAGYVAWWGKIASEDAHVLQILYAAGAVFFARTTQPQSMMHLETDSNLYGVTVNPYDRNVTCGGSSGGEGALLGMKGSCLGIGSDIGGLLFFITTHIAGKC